MTRGLEWCRIEFMVVTRPSSGFHIFTLFDPASGHPHSGHSTPCISLLEKVHIPRSHDELPLATLTRTSPEKFCAPNQSQCALGFVCNGFSHKAGI